MGTAQGEFLFLDQKMWMDKPAFASGLYGFLVNQLGFGIG